MDNQIIREQICEVGRRMYLRKMVASNDGNISVRLSDGTILCTPTGVSKGHMVPECICRIGVDGSIWEASDEFRPSSEIKMHQKVYEKRADIQAVVHAHPVFATTFAVGRQALTAPITAESVMFLGDIPVTSFAAPSTMEVPESIEEYVMDYNAMLLANHGALTYETNLIKAYEKMEALEFYAELLYRTGYFCGAKELNNDEILKIKRLI